MTTRSTDNTPEVEESSSSSEEELDEAEKQRKEGYLHQLLIKPT
jgi:hypothetical protein